MQLIEDPEMCPKGWALTTVGDACIICDNLRLPLNVEQRQLMQGEFPYYGPTGVLDYLNEFRLNGTYALIGEDGDHFLKFWDWPMTQLVNGKFNVNNHAHIVQGKGDCLTEWFYLYFHHMCLRPVLTLQGVGRYKLTRQGLERLPIVVPPVREQKRLVAIIQQWTEATNILAKLIAAKLRFKQGLMQQLLTGQRRFKGFDGEMKLVRMGDIAQEVSERNTCGDEVTVLSCTKHDGLVDSLTYFGKRVFSEDTSPYKVVRRNEFAYATNHIEEGSIGLLIHSDIGLVSPMYTVFRTNGQVVPQYLFRVLKTETLRQVFASFTSASVNRRGSLRWKQFSTIQLRLPSKEEQTKINDLMSIADHEIDLLRKQLAALKQQKKGLMQKLLTGQVRIKE
jgi:type I restriction enzyme S subunit